MKRPTYFSSDWHLFHENCLAFDSRPFKDLDEMHHNLIKNFNALVPKDGLTYFLGDMSMGKGDEVVEIIKQLHGDKILIVGNHDARLQKLQEAFIAIQYNATIKIAGQMVSLSHCPLRKIHREQTKGMKHATGMECWHGFPRNKDFSVEDVGQFHLSGHIHSPNKGNSIRELGRQFDVGVTANNYKPVSIKQIHQWIDKIKPLVTCWRDVVGFPGYKINKIGEIKSFRRYSEGRLLHPAKDKDGYLVATMQQNGIAKKEKIHRAVAKAFLANQNNYLEVNHKNGHKLDNSIRNLEWCSLQCCT